jgi:hypothetical protein
MFLATSDNVTNCLKTFCRRTNYPPILYEFHLDPRLGCVHVNYVDRTNIAGEREFLFVPYSVFTVERVTWKPNPNWADPHEMVLKVAIDNTFHSEELPLAPWH